MFTQEHYESVARIICAARKSESFALHDGMSDMVEGGRITAADIPDDYDWLVETLAEQANVIGRRLDALVETFADYFEQDNELFARKAFIGACRAASRSEIRRLVAQSNDKNYQKGQRAKAAAQRHNEKW